MYEIIYDAGILTISKNKEGPFLLQPSWPDGTPWASEIEAKTWANVLIASIEDITKPLPGDNPAQPTKPAPTPQPKPWEIDPTIPNPFDSITD